MAVYSPGRRRAMLLLLLTSVLLITIDQRGSALVDVTRSAFNGAMRPIENATEVVARPVRNAWRGVTQYDDLQEENRGLRAQIDGMRSNDIVARGVIALYHTLLAEQDLSFAGRYDTVTATVIGQSPSNIDQVIEIDKGRDDGLRVGMPVVTSAGLIGKVTEPLLRDQAAVMLITDPRYAVEVRILAQQPLPTTSTSSTTTTTEPEAQIVGSVPDATAVTTEPSPTTELPATTEGSTTTTTTTTLPAERETGQLRGDGPAEPPVVELIADSPAFGNPQVGDLAQTSGGRQSFAPSDIPIGEISRVRRGSPSEGLILEVEPLANLNTVEFVQVILYRPPTESAVVED